MRGIVEEVHGVTRARIDEVATAMGSVSGGMDALRGELGGLAIDDARLTEAVVRAVGPVTSGLEQIHGQLQEFHARSSADEELAASMHRRIEQLQAGESKKLLRPIITDLVSLYGVLVQAERAVEDGIDADTVRRMLAGYGEQVEDILDHLGLVEVEAEVGGEFDARKHNGVKKVPTGDEKLDRTISAVDRPGFHDPTEPKPVVPARVRVYRYDPQLVAADGAAEDQAHAVDTADAADRMDTAEHAGTDDRVGPAASESAESAAGSASACTVDATATAAAPDASGPGAEATSGTTTAAETAGPADGRV